MPQRLTRSENMARIRGKHTRPEMMLRKALWAKGLRYRLYTDLPGRPDIVFLQARLAIFVDGCFWHGCPIHYSAPRTREAFWKAKLRTNVLRDMAADDALKTDRWQVLRIWQHELSAMDNVTERISGMLKDSEKVTSDKADRIPSAQHVSEPMVLYGKREGQPETWWMCPYCQSNDVKVLAVEGFGSLRPGSAQKPERAELIWQRCRSIWGAEVR